MADYSEKYNLNIEVNDEKAKAELAEIDALAKKLEKDKATIKVAVSDSKAKEDLTSILALAQKLDNMRVDIRVAVNGDKQVIAQLSAIQKIQKQSSKERIAQAQIAQKAEAQANVLAERRANNEAKRLQTATNQAQRLADIRANNEAKLAQRQPIIDSQVSKMALQQEGQMLRNAQSLINLQNKLANQGNVWTNIGKGISQVSTQLSTMSNVANTASTALAGVAKPLLMIGGTGALGLGAGIAQQVKGAISYGMEVEKAQNQLKAQGLSAKQVADIYQNEIVPFANTTPFDVANMTDGISAVNSYVGDIKKSTKATKIFGTALFATGRGAEDLNNVAVNLGQLNTNGFSKADYKELVRGVPTISAALRDMNINSWEEFNQALGDNPATKEIERTGNALDLIMEAQDKYNIKTHAMEEANKSLSVKMDNMKGQYQTMRDNVFKTSGAYDKFGKVVDTLGDKLNSPAMEKAMTKMFKGAIPLLDNLEKAIDDFDISKFVDGVGRGFDTVKKTIDDLVNNPVVKFGKNTISKMLGLEGGAENIGANIGKMLSAGIKLGVASISFKGIALGTRGLAGIAGLTGSLATSIGKTIAGSKARRQIAKVTEETLATEITAGLSVGSNKAMSRASKNVKQGWTSKFASGMGNIGKGLGAVGGGIGGVGIGTGLLAGGTFAMSRSIRDVSDTIKKISDDMPTDLADLNALNSKIDNFVRWANQLGEINLGGQLGQATAMVATTMTALGGAAIATGNIPMGAALVGAGVLTEGIQTLQAFNEKLKIDSIMKLVDLPEKLDSMPDLDGKAVASKISKLDSTVSQIMTALQINKTVEAGQVTGATSTLATNIDTINRAFPPELTLKLSDTFKNLNDFTTSLNAIGDVGQIADKAVAGIKNVSEAIDKLTNSELFKPKGMLLQNGSHAIGPVDPSSFGIKKGNNDFSTYDNTLAHQLEQFQAQLKPFTDGTIDLDIIISSMTKMNALFAKINSIPDLGKPEAITAKMTSISTVMNGIQKAFQPLSGDGGKAPELIDTRWMDNMVQSVNKLMPIIQSMTALPEPSDVTPKIDMIRTTMEKIQMAFRPVAAAGGGGSTELVDTRWMDNMIQSVNKLVPVIQSMAGLPEPDDVTPKIDMIQTTMTKIQQAFAVQGGGDLVDTRWMDNMIASVGKLIPVMQELASMPDPATIIPKIDAVQMVLQRLQALSAGNGGSEFTAPNFAPMISQLSQLNIQIQQVASQKGSVDALANSFPPIARNADTATTSVNRLKSAIDALPSSKTITINLNDNASSTLREIVALLGSVVDKTVTVTTNKVTKEKSAVGGVIGNPAKFAEGGLVSRMFKNASRSFKQGQDTVHALLSQGEAVIRRSAVARVGTSFIDNLNHGNLQGAYQDLSSRVATNYNKSVANNQTYNNSPQIIQHFHGSQNQGNQFLRQQMKGIQNV
ncbi:MAG: hypothetical protein ACRCX2_38705 [Paraclostridium sp.]